MDDLQVTKTMRSLALRCVIAVALLVMLVMANFMVIRQQILESREVNAVNAVCARQLLLVQHSAARARRLVHTTDEVEATDMRTRLTADLEGLRANHIALVAGNFEAGIPPPEAPQINEVLYDKPHEMHARGHRYIQAMQRLVESHDVSPRHEAYIELEHMLSRSGLQGGSLQTGLVEYLAYYRGLSDIRDFRLELLNRWFFTSSVAILGFVAVLVFWPMIRRIRQEMAGQLRLTATLEQRVADRTSALVARARELEQSNDALRELRTAMENAVEGIARLDADGRYTAANAAYVSLVGRGATELLGQRMAETVLEADRPRLGEAAETARDQGKAELELRGCDARGEIYHAEITLVRAYDRQRHFDGFHCFAKSITGRKLVEQALRESEERFRQLTDHLQQVLWLSEPDWARMIYVSPAFEDVFGRRRESLYESVALWDEAIHRDDRQRVAANRTTRQLTGAYDEEYRIVRPDGTVRWIRDRAFPIRLDGQEVSRIAGIAEDVTQAREMQQQLLRSQRSFENLIMNCDVAMIVTDSNGLTKFVNPAAEALLHRQADDLLGQVFPAAVMQQERNEMPLVRDDGLPGTAEISLIRTEWDGEIAHLLILHDISDRKRAEEDLQAYAEELKRSNKELEDFAFVASHDLQEPLRKIKSFGDRLVKKCYDNLEGDGKMYLDRMQSAAERMDGLIRDLLTYSRVTTKGQPFAQVDLNLVVREVLVDLEVRIEQSQGTVEVEALPTIEADRTQMRQLFQNLIGNALKFRRKDMPPVVRVYAERVFERPPGIHETQGLAPEAMCRLMVEDQGIGFDEKYLDRIFEVFQRLHGRDAYEGTGTGLAVCRKIAVRHGGSITARSRPDEGATFIVTLPFAHPEST